MAKVLEYKGHPLQRKDNIIYYGSFADKYIIMMQILDTKKVGDLDVATKVSVQLQLTDSGIKSRDRIVKKAERRGRRVAGTGARRQVSGFRNPSAGGLRGPAGTYPGDPTILTGGAQLFRYTQRICFA